MAIENQKEESNNSIRKPLRVGIILGKAIRWWSRSYINELL